MITPKVNADEIRRAVRELRKVEPETLKQLRRDLRSKIGPLAQQVAEAVPAEAPLSGMEGDWATGWTKVRPSVTFTPGRSRKTGNHLISIRITPIEARRGLYIAELAGSRSAGKKPSGIAMIRELNKRFAMKKRGGRFAYDRFRTLRPGAIAIARQSINSVIGSFNRKLKI
jgi:hypothetical protein